MTDHHSRRTAFFLLLLAIFLVILDQFTKYLAVVHLKNQNPVVLISGVLELRYLENTGAAFSMLQNQQWFFYLITAVFLVVAVWAVRKILKTGKYMPLLICITVHCAGAVGNLIDRMVHRYVVDFIYFSLINFPIFNVADIYVTLGVIVLICFVLFRYRESDYEEIFSK